MTAHIDSDGLGKEQRAWNDMGLLREWREGWAELANARLAEPGHDTRIDHRSLRDQGTELQPQHEISAARMRSGRWSTGPLRGGTGMRCPPVPRSRWMR